jgi:hypothetical protein
MNPCWQRENGSCVCLKPRGKYTYDLQQHSKSVHLFDKL